MSTAPAPQPRITVYGTAVTPYTIKVMRALHWKRLPYALEEPQSADDYRRWSPKNGLLPVIDVDGTRVQDSAAILDLLDARFPDPPLVSADARVAREQRRLEHWIDETFPFYILRWMRSRTPMGRAGELSELVGPLLLLASDASAFMTGHILVVDGGWTAV